MSIVKKWNIQDHDRRVGNGCTCNGEELALALREVAAVTGKHRLITLRKAGDKAVGTG